MHICMNWDSINFDWNHARAFLATAELGSLTAAAKSLNVSQPTLSRQVIALEKSLGVVLFERDGKGIAITPAGTALLEQVKIMAAAANEFNLVATGKSESLEGCVCISVAEFMAIYILPPIIKKIRRLEPGITIKIIAEDAVSNISAHEADIAIRFFRPTQDELITKKVSDIHAQLYATPEYLDSIGNPQHPSEFKSEHFLGVNQVNEMEHVFKEKGFDVALQHAPVITENMLLHWALVKQGVGIGFMLADIGEKEESVQRILHDLPNFGGELWLVTHRELWFSKRIKRVFEMLDEELQHIKSRFILS